MRRRVGALLAAALSVVLVVLLPLYRHAREIDVLEATLRQQLKEHRDATEIARGTVLCLGVRHGDGVPEDASSALLSRLGDTSSVGPLAACTLRPEGAVVAASGKPAIVVVAGPIEWRARDDALVTVSYFRAAHHSAQRHYRVARVAGTWTSLGAVVSDAPF